MWRVGPSSVQVSESGADTTSPTANNEPGHSGRSWNTNGGESVLSTARAVEAVGAVQVFVQFVFALHLALDLFRLLADAAVQDAVCRDVASWMENAMGWRVIGTAPSPRIDGSP